MASNDFSETVPRPNKMQFSLDLRFIVGLLLVIIIAMLAIWKPWYGLTAGEQTIEVTGEAKLSAKPDEFVFSPTYQFKNSDKNAAIADLTKKSDTVTAKLKELGVAEKNIKTNSSGYDYPVLYEDKTNTPTYSLQFTITIPNQELSQKVQDYLVTTEPTGAVSPQATFSDTVRKDLESKARDEATKDARVKADQMAKNLGFKIKKVKAVSDSGGFGVMPYAIREGVAVDLAKPTSSLAVQPGENDLNYSVRVIYFIR